jgi:DNA polymerase-1
VPDAEIEKTMKVVKEVMENALELSVPLVTEARLGSNWGELEKVDEEPVVLDLEG